MINNNGKGVSIVFPDGCYDGCRVLSESAIHDLGLDSVCRKLSDKVQEQNLILDVMSRICADPEVVRYRLDVFEDIYNNPAFRERMLEREGVVTKVEENARGYYVTAVFGKDEVIYHANGDADDEGDSLECEGMHGSS